MTFDKLRPRRTCSPVTRFIASRARLGTFPIVAESSDPTGAYSMVDSGGIEHEVGDFLYGLTRLFKPKRCLTTGTRFGISDAYVALALEHNGSGELVTVEINPYSSGKAVELFESLGVSDRVTAVVGDALDVAVDGRFQIAFLDTEHRTRFAEFAEFYEQIDSGGVIAIHDLKRDCPESVWGEIPKTVVDALRSGELAKAHFPNPRGLTLFYKRHPLDFAIP